MKLLTINKMKPLLKIIAAIALISALSAPVLKAQSDMFEVEGGILANGDLQVGGDTNISGGLNVTGSLTANSMNMGELAIGTSQPVPNNFKLAVGGNIIASGIDIKIPQKWPDYVFAPDYKLMTLEELQRYIKYHGHLPGLPPAAEMEKNEHYSVGELNMKLLEKVEELSLYVLQLKEEIDALKKDTGNK